MKAKSHDGFGDDWPIAYGNIEPHYDKVERSIGVAGEDIGVWHSPNNCFLKPFNLTCAEQSWRRGTRKIGRRVVLSEERGDRAHCHFCSSYNCSRGCDSGAMFNSIYVTLPHARGTGRFTLRPNTIVREVTLNDEDRATGVIFFADRLMRQTYEITAKAVILGASCLESARVLLDSRSRQFPAGLANSSGVLGHCLHDHTMTESVVGFAPELYNAKVTNHDAKLFRSRNIDSRENLTLKIRALCDRAWSFLAEEFKKGKI